MCSGKQLIRCHRTRMALTLHIICRPVPERLAVSSSLSFLHPSLSALVPLQRLPDMVARAKPILPLSFSLPPVNSYPKSMTKLGNSLTAPGSAQLSFMVELTSTSNFAKLSVGVISSVPHQVASSI